MKELDDNTIGSTIDKSVDLGGKIFKNNFNVFNFLNKILGLKITSDYIKFERDFNEKIVKKN